MKERLTGTEEIARRILESNWDNLLRATPAAAKEFRKEFPRLCELVNRKMAGEADVGNVFRPGVPDFLAFDDDGDYCFVEAKGEGDGLRHSQLKWFRDFQDLRAEIWFTDSNEGVTEKMDSDRLDAYSLKKPETADSGNARVRAGEGNFLEIEIPETLAAVMNLEEGDSVSWSVLDETSLELDTN